MRLLEEKIMQRGKVKPGNVLKVDSFLNHQIDADLLADLAREVYSLFKDSGVTKIVTVETSGIALACFTAQYFHIPMVFAKKKKSINISDKVYSSEVYSFTHQQNYNIMVSSEYLSSSEKVLIIDDFLANGCAMRGLIDIVNQAGAEIVGIAVAIEKGFQGGGDQLRKDGYRVESLAIIDSFTDNGGIIFRQ